MPAEARASAGCLLGEVISDQEARGKVISYQFSVVSKERKRQSPERVEVNADAQKEEEKSKDKAYAEVTENTEVAEKRNPRAQTLRG